MDSIKISEAGKWHRGASDGRCLLSHLWVLVASTSLREVTQASEWGCCALLQRRPVSLLFTSESAPT